MQVFSDGQYETMRIVTLLPSATEIVCLLGLREHLVGVSHACDFPPGVDALPRVTRTRLLETATSSQIDASVREALQRDALLYELDVHALDRLQPDLIITQSLCSVCAVSEREVQKVASQLRSQPTIVRLNPQTLEQVIDSVQQVGRAALVAARAAEVSGELYARVATVAARSQSIHQRPRVVLLEWLDPLFSAGHWNPQLVSLGGGDEIIGQAGAPSRQLKWEEVVDANPDVLMIACCGLSIDRTLDDLPTLVSYAGFAQLKCIGAGHVYLVDGSQYFNRPGPRLVDSLELIAHTLHPELHPLPSHIEPAVRMKREARKTPGFS